MKGNAEMVTKDTNINELVERDPQAVGAVFFSLGLGCLGCALAHSETIGDACATHGLDLDETLKLLNEAVGEA